MLERLLAAMDVQLVVGVEPLDAHLDARIDDLAARPIAERIDELGLDELLDRLTDFPQVITGSTAALLQGAPVPADALEIALRWRDSKPFTHWLETNYGQRWNARWGEFGGVWLEPGAGRTPVVDPVRGDQGHDVRRAARDDRGAPRRAELPGGAACRAGAERAARRRAVAPLPGPSSWPTAG